MRSKSIRMCTRALESWVMSMWLLWHSTSQPSRRMREPPNGVTILTSATWPRWENGRGAPRSLALSSSDESCIMAERWLAAHKSAMSITEARKPQNTSVLRLEEVTQAVDEKGNFDDISDRPDCILHRVLHRGPCAPQSVQRRAGDRRLTPRTQNQAPSIESARRASA